MWSATIGQQLEVWFLTRIWSMWSLATYLAATLSCGFITVPFEAFADIAVTGPTGRVSPPAASTRLVPSVCVHKRQRKSEKDRKIKQCNSASQKTQNETQNRLYWELRLIGSLKRGAFALKLDMKFCCKIKAVDSDCKANMKVLVWKKYIILSFVII